MANAAAVLRQIDLRDRVPIQHGYATRLALVIAETLRGNPHGGRCIAKNLLADAFLLLHDFTSPSCSLELHHTAWWSELFYHHRGFSYVII